MTIETNFLVHCIYCCCRCSFGIDVNALFIRRRASENYSGALLIYLVFRFTDSNYWSVHGVLLILTFPLCHSLSLSYTLW